MSLNNSAPDSSGAFSFGADMEGIYSDDHLQMQLDIKTIVCKDGNMYITTSKSIYKIIPKAIGISVMGGSCSPLYLCGLRRTLINFLGWLQAKIAGV